MVQYLSILSCANCQRAPANTSHADGEHSQIPHNPTANFGIFTTELSATGEGKTVCAPRLLFSKLAVLDTDTTPTTNNSTIAHYAPFSASTSSLNHISYQDVSGYVRPNANRGNNMLFMYTHTRLLHAKQTQARFTMISTEALPPRTPTMGRRHPSTSVRHTSFASVAKEQTNG